MRIRSLITHSAQALAEGALISLLVIGLMAGTAFAGKGGRTPAPTGACAVAPTTVAAGEDYTINGWSLGAGRVVQVWIADSVGTMAWYLQADSAGALSLSWHANAAGSSTVTFRTTDSRKATTIATCSFTVT